MGDPYHDGFVVVAEEVTEANVVDVSVSEAPSPAPVPSAFSEESVSNYDSSRSYTEFINDNTPSETYCVNGISYYINNGVNGSKICDMMIGHGGCRACTARAKKFFSLIGPSGPVFLNNVRGPKDGCERHTLFNIREEVKKVNKVIVNPSIFIIGAGTFPPVNSGVDSNTGDNYEHVTIHPDQVTSSSDIIKYKDFLRNQVQVVQPRLEKLCMNNTVIESVDIIRRNLHRLERPDHWTEVIEWIQNIHKQMAPSTSYSHLTPASKMKLAVYALTTGRISSDGHTIVHKSYKQSSNIVDFLTLGPIEDVLKEMDFRSAPENYMVSQLARNMAKHKVTSKYTISLVWSGNYRDDLDIHVFWFVPGENKKEIFYGNKSVCVITRPYTRYNTRLDFDANASRSEKEPAENVTCVPYGRYEVYVNNYHRRTVGDIPFTVIIHQDGKDDIILERTWTASRNTGDLLHIASHSFTESCNPELKMSRKASSRASNIQSEWDEKFGNPTCSIPFVEDLESKYKKKMVNRWNRVDNNCISQGSDVTSTFMNLAIQSKKKKRMNTNDGKVFLSQRPEYSLPSTITELIKYLSNGSHSLMIDPRNFSPGYITTIHTKSNVMKTPFSLNHYKDKFKIPNKPTVNGNARFTNNWFSNCTDIYHMHNVEVMSLIEFGKNWFAVIRGARLPENDPDFPLCGGFHPGKLHESLHSKHNYQWTYCNTQVLPQVEYSSDKTPLIGTFLVSKDVEFILNGSKITVSVNDL